ncbi:MAG: glucosamine-6-phosphate isomerase [Verrucomicrobia bacterium]|nr:glucosamine-6-phosphate isomerase [Verrucomicrobiota bacterium]
MSRPLSKLAPEWWDYTTLDKEILDDASKLDEKGIKQLARPSFQVAFYDTAQEFYCAEALEYIEAFKQATPSKPAGICGPIGPTEQLPLVARMVNALGINLKNAHFWGMDEWVIDGKPVDVTHPMSFARCDKEMCFNRVDRKLRMPEENLHFPTGDLEKYSRSYDAVRCVVMQGGQGEIKHWAFNDPLQRAGQHKDQPPTPAEFRQLKTRVVKLHPVTIIQNARTSGGGNVALVPTHAATVGPFETWKAEKISIWHPGHHDNPMGIRLSALMISKRAPDASVPMSLLADHPNVHFHYLRPGFGKVEVEMH